jgi:serine/threonine protein phosphatase 1
VTDHFAFIGDIHGNLSALRGIYNTLKSRGQPHLLFLGDYINKGSQSSQVIEELLGYTREGHATLLAGNHEIAMLDALKSGDLTPFLRMGGAMTIRSYVGGSVGPLVADEFRANVPASHLVALQNMAESFESSDFLAQHSPRTEATTKFQISAHVPVGKLPQISDRSASLDTGCGGDESGRLTALLWPSLDYVQVNSRGIIVVDD